MGSTPLISVNCKWKIFKRKAVSILCIDLFIIIALYTIFWLLIPHYNGLSTVIIEMVWNINTLFIRKYYPIVWKGLEHPWILVSSKDPESLPHGYGDKATFPFFSVCFPGVQDICKQICNSFNSLIKWTLRTWSTFPSLEFIKNQSFKLW